MAQSKTGKIDAESVYKLLRTVVAHLNRLSIAAKSTRNIIGNATNIFAPPQQTVEETKDMKPKRFDQKDIADPKKKTEDDHV